MKKTPPIFQVNSLEDLSISVYVLGFRAKGESTIILVKDKEKTIYSIITDCYDGGNVLFNKIDVEKILSANNVDKIDAFIWTHPHDDHSKGIIQLLNHKDKDNQAVIYTPRCIDGKVDDFAAAQVPRKVVKYLNRYYNKGIKGNFHSIELDLDCIPNDENRVAMSYTAFIVIDESNFNSCNKYTATLHFLLPSNQVISKEKEKLDPKHPNIDLNCFSIVYYFSFNKDNYLLCGDYKDFGNTDWIKSLPYNFMFIKIPHHGSKRASEIVDTLYERMFQIDCYSGQSNSKNDFVSEVSVSTVFTNRQLPDDDMLKKYSRISKKVYCTGSRKDQKYGIVNMVFSVKGGGRLVETNLIGSAHECMCSE